MAVGNPILESLRVMLAKRQAGQNGGLADTSMTQGLVKAMEKAEADAAKVAAMVPAVVEPEVEDEEAIAPISSPIRLCLFDLDDTLLRTGDLEPFRGAANANNASQQYTESLMAAYHASPVRMIYSQQQLMQLRQEHRQIKWGIFTRAPRHYARSLLGAAYPELHWDTVICYEDVQRTKPYGDGIWAAMRRCDIQYVDQVAMVGDDKIDIQTAYYGGCWAILDQSSWTRPWASSRYWAIERVADAVIDDPAKLSCVLAHPKGYWPELEYHRDSDASMAGRVPRFDSINHFFPRPDRDYVPITVLGRFFGEYVELGPRRKWHALTDEILAHKDADEFPAAWVQALRSYLYRVGGGGDCVVTVIPFKHGRPARLEALLNQVQQSHLADLIREGMTYTFAPSLLAFRQGAVSSHGQHLTREQRFVNLGEHLYVALPEQAQGKRIVVIDDVTTTGATLLWAHRYLAKAGAQSVICVSLTKAVGIG